MDATEQTFDDVVLARSHERPVVVDFWAEWCGPCRMLGPVLEREVDDREGLVELAKVDVDANQELARQYGIQGIPAVKAFRDGEVVAEFVGARGAPTVAAFLDELTAPPARERILAELEESGRLPDVAAALAAGDTERVFELLLDRIQATEDPERRGLVELAVALFGDLGQEHPVTVRYRRRLAATLY